MKTMLACDLLVSRSMLLQMFGICAVVGIVMCYAMGTAVGAVAALAAMAPFMYVFSIAGIDEQNGWERFRLTLPLSRRQVVFGRYASVLVVTICASLFAFVLGLLLTVVNGFVSDGVFGEQVSQFAFEAASPGILLASVTMTAFVVFVGTTVALPLIARFGMTKATRFIPLVVVLVLAIGVGVSGSDAVNFGLWDTVSQWLDSGSATNLALLLAGLFVFGLVLYTISAFIAAKLYEKREL